MEALFLLAVLACPVGMGLMMWFMAKGMRGEKHTADANRSESVDLRREQARLAAEIDQLEQNGPGRPTAQPALRGK